jgi:aspartate aminotransferase-like enzyme
MAERLIHHRGPAFREVFGRVREGLEWLFETDSDVVTVTASGTGAFEAAMTNFTSRGDTVICIGGGKFGERWADVGREHELDVVQLDVEWGEPVDPSRLQELLEAHPDCTMVTLTASETSTGVFHPVADIASVVREHSDALLAVDGITAVGVHSMPMDELELDVVVGGSQKAFGVPPGLGFVAANQRAWDREERSDHPRYYFDLRRERDRQRDNQTAFTPGISQVVALDVALEMMRDEGRHELLDRHDRHASAVRSAVRSLGMEVVAERYSNAVTAVRAPEGVEAPKIVQKMRSDHQAVIAGGQKQFGPVVFRLGHLGFFERRHIVNMISALELTLTSLGADIDDGAGLEAAQGVYATSQKLGEKDG